MINERLQQIKENYNSLVALEDIYYKICGDYALLSDEMVEAIRKSQGKKKELKKLDFKTMAEFEREYELGEEYIIIKSIKYQMKGYERLLSGLKVRLESLKAETRGQY